MFTCEPNSCPIHEMTLLCCHSLVSPSSLPRQCFAWIPIRAKGEMGGPSFFHLFAHSMTFTTPTGNPIYNLAYWILLDPWYWFPIAWQSSCWVSWISIVIQTQDTALLQCQMAYTRATRFHCTCFLTETWDHADELTWISSFQNISRIHQMLIETSTAISGNLDNCVK